jgi:hypothetical protein
MLVAQVADACVGPGAPASFQSGRTGFGGDLREARALSPASTARALAATQSSAAGSPDAWKLHAAPHRYSIL